MLGLWRVSGYNAGAQKNGAHFLVADFSRIEYNKRNILQKNGIRAAHRRLKWQK